MKESTYLYIGMGLFALLIDVVSKCGGQYNLVSLAFFFLGC